MTQKLNALNTVTAFQDPSGKAARTAIVVPCYNEEKRLDKSAFLSFLVSSPNTDFVFVNDGSKDATLHVLCALRDTMPARVHVIDLARNSGKAEAVRQGLIAASEMGAGFVGYWDADLATPLDAIDDFSRILMKFAETQVVFGARRVMLGHRIERTLGRRCVSRICATLARQAVRLPIGDTQCGAKLMRNTPVLRKAIANPFSAGWLFDVELFARLSSQMSQKRFAFYEQPLAEWTEVAGSKVSGAVIAKSGIRMLQLICEMRFGIAFGKGKEIEASARILPATIPAQAEAA